MGTVRRSSTHFVREHPIAGFGLAENLGQGIRERLLTCRAQEGNQERRRRPRIGDDDGLWSGDERLNGRATTLVVATLLAAGAVVVARCVVAMM